MKIAKTTQPNSAKSISKRERVEIITDTLLLILFTSTRSSFKTIYRTPRPLGMRIAKNPLNQLLAKEYVKSKNFCGLIKSVGEKV